MTDPTASSEHTDYDVLNAIFVAKQRLAHAENEFESAKETRKLARENLDRELLKLDAHVVKRRDEMGMPKMPDLPGFALDGKTGGPIEGAELPGSLRDEPEEETAYVRCTICNMSYIRNAKPDLCGGCGTPLP